MSEAKGKLAAKLACSHLAQEVEGFSVLWKIVNVGLNALNGSL